MFAFKLAFSCEFSASNICILDNKAELTSTSVLDGFPSDDTNEVDKSSTDDTSEGTPETGWVSDECHQHQLAVHELHNLNKVAHPQLLLMIVPLTHHQVYQYS